MKHHLIGAFAVVALMSAPTAWAQELPEDIAASGVVRIALEPAYVPMEYFDPETGELTGFDVELARAMAEILGVEIEYQEGTFESLTPALQSGRADMIMSGFYDRPARREYFDFINYLVAGAQFFGLESNTELTEPTDLCGESVSTIRATSYPETIETFSNEFCVAAGLEPITVSPDSDVPQMLINLRTGRVAGAVQGLESVPALMANEPGTYKPVGEPIGSALMGMAFNKDDTVLRDAFVYALRETISNGTYDELIAKYQLELSAYPEPTINGEPIE
ncbi:ABC transporter substrate-binding protein [Arsenicitalea aurantiaca]|uniref:ABC transporter substrate-binding protein n=1 Tax=Arsenicitalea aurantiaca TaxID=1783274 RepID=A0A433X7K1_9HYPH|nr:ABC transporter substrate-binding protein [Arsenicitalea aurantiaca]RUT30067.1 ABC transporter substrate-binding protein [Arsenicitalea aurantiaca]